MPRKKLLPTPQSSDHITKKTSKSWKEKGATNFTLSNPELLEQNEVKPSQSQQLPLLRADSLASLYLKPGSEEARKMTAGSGHRCLESYQRLGPLGSLQRMLLDSSRWGSTIVYLTWKVRAMKQSRLLFQLAVSMPRTGELESSLWATLSMMDTRMDIRKPEERTPEANKGGCANLREQVMWPTPRAVESDRNSVVSQANYYQKTGHHRNLKAAVGTVPTPTSRDWRSGKASEETMNRNARPLSEVIGGQLNPNWVEWLMGFPPGWTDLNV
ncbi:hypothetical protein LCGC14_0792290 [marine sediment metagenome]|uniref:Uncharacterized protein n=1 Tax=marine sediment metagenome TaxID=412755 RepID=A0A0F9PWI4_9ZZZZ